jgi:hypothetical protein
MLLKALSQGHSSFRQKKLEEALRASLTLAERSAEPVQGAAQPVKAIHVDAVVLPEQQVNETEDPYRKKWLPYYIEMNALRHALLSTDEDVQRGDMAHRILKNERICMMYWDRREYYLRTKEHMPEDVEESAIVTDKNLILKTILNVRSYITKAKKRLNSADTQEKRDAAQERLSKYSLQLIELENQLGYA